MNEQKINNYLGVLADLKSERKELDSLILKFEQRIILLKGATSDKAILQPDLVLPTLNRSKTNKRTKRKKLGVTDTAVEILEEIGYPMHAKLILEDLHKRGRTQTTIKSLTGSMPQDVKKRFENLGKNIWALTAWSEDTKARYRDNATQTNEG